MHTIGIQAVSGFEAQAQVLSQRLALPLISNDDKNQDRFTHFLCIDNTGLSLKTHPPTTSLHIDFTQGQLAYRQAHLSRRNELLVRALGYSQDKLTVLDATAGLGRDAFLMASLGHSLILLERNPVLAALLADGIARLQTQDSTIQMTIHNIDAFTYCKTLSGEKAPDIIYLDPMHPDRKKSALVKGNLRVLRDLVGSDPDSHDLLPLALVSAKRRVIVKRPRLSPHLNNQIPSFCLEGNHTRFDVYQRA